MATKIWRVLRRLLCRSKSEVEPCGPSPALIGLLVLLVAATTYLALRPRHDRKAPSLPPTPLPVAIITVAPTSLPEIVILSGRIEADQTVTVAAEHAGRITHLGAAKGDDVGEGQILLRVDSATQEAALEKAAATLRQAQNDLERTVEMLKNGAVSVRDHENAQTLAALAKADFLEKKADLDRCQVASPIRAVVEQRFVETGEYVLPGAPVYRLVALERIKAAVELAEADALSVRRGDVAGFTVDTLPDMVFSGTVRYVATAADPGSNTFRAEIEADNPGRILRPGLLVRVPICRRMMTDVLAVPLEALVPSKGEYIAYVAEEGRAVRRLVKIRALVGRLAVIQSGLAPGERLVVEGQRLLADGSPLLEVAATATSRTAVP